MIYVLNLKGNGSFIKYIKLLCNNYKFYDIEPENPKLFNKIFLI